jgi:Apea-like HEPN
MSIRPLETINKALLSSTSSFTGEYLAEGLLITHAWPSSSQPSSSARLFEGPASRNAFVFVFETTPLVPLAGAGLPDYSEKSAQFSWCLSVLFGKRFDNHGITESSGLFRLPNLDHFASLSRHTLPHNSRTPRIDFPVPLVLDEIQRINPFILNSTLDDSFIQIFLTAAKFYAQALQMYERDSEVSYLHLVTAIEILSNFQSTHPTDFYDATTKNYLAVVRKGLPDGIKIANHFKGKMLSIKKKFVATMMDLVDEDFFTRSESSEEFGRLKRESLKKTVSAAYDLRSKYVHTGVPFGKWIEDSIGIKNREVQFGCPVVDNKAYGNTLASAPTFVGLERLARYCLLKLAERQGAYVAPVSQSHTTSNVSVNS